MGMVASQQRIASAFAVFCGHYGDVSRYAHERGVCRQWVYREAALVVATLDGKAQREEHVRLRARVQELEQQNVVLAERLAQAVVLDDDKQAEFASLGQARGVSLPDCRELLEVLVPGQSLSVATLGRRTKAAGEKAAQLLPVLDELARQQVRQLAADEIYVKAPVLMMVEQESLYWASGQLTASVSGEAWVKEFAQLSNLEQVTRDGGKGLAKGVALVNEQRQKQERSLVVDQGDHFHAFLGGHAGVRKAEMQACKTLAAAEVAQKAVEECQRQGQDARSANGSSLAAWHKAEQAMDVWMERERLWQETKEAMQLITPTGELNTRQQAEAVLAKTLPQLPDSDFAKTKRQLQKAEMLNYLDHVQRQVKELPFPEEVKKAAVRQEAVRRRPELLQGESGQAAVLRTVMLTCAVALSKVDDQGQAVVAAVRDIFRKAYRASSLVECINSVLRMQQARHRKMTQGLLDLKRLYWNCHTFRTGRRRGTTPYQRLGVPWPEGMRWWDVLKLTPEQLRNTLSTAKTAK